MPSCYREFIAGICHRVIESSLQEICRRVIESSLQEICRRVIESSLQDIIGSKNNALNNLRLNFK